jgi:hypothetical protein
MALLPLLARSAAPLAALLLLGACSQVSVAPSSAAAASIAPAPPAAVPVVQESDLPPLPPELSSSITVVEPPRPVVVVQPAPPPVVVVPPPPPVIVVRPPPQVVLLPPPPSVVLLPPPSYPVGPGAWLPVTH